MTIRPSFLLLPAALFFGACAGDVRTTRQSPPQPSRTVPAGRPGSQVLPTRRSGALDPTRVYLITRLETAQAPRGEWRSLGENILLNGSTISFTSLGDNRTVTFTGPYQLTPTRAQTDRGTTQLNSEVATELRGSSSTPGR